MPFKVPVAARRFIFTLSPADLPVGKVERWGKGLWLIVCPLCGMLHDVTRLGAQATEYEPTCIVRQTHPEVYRRWLALHPLAADYTRVSLRMQTPNIIPLPSQPGTVGSDQKAA